MGKGYILPAPILPTETWSSTALPTPMTIAQDKLPIALLANDPEGHEILRLPLGKLSRDHTHYVDLSRETKIKNQLSGQFGHMELVYDFSSGGEGDGWLHSLFRFENRATGNVAETSFGAHIFNVRDTTCRLFGYHGLVHPDGGFSLDHMFGF